MDGGKQLGHNQRLQRQLTDEWFNEYMFRLVVEKKYVPADIMDLMSQKPIMLPSWDPMFAPEE